MIGSFLQASTISIISRLGWALTGNHGSRESEGVVRLSSSVSARVVAALLALSLAAPALALVETAASCCCALKKADCHCPVCNHARELASGESSFEQCGTTGAAAARISLPEVLPPLRLQAAPLPRPLPASRPTFPAREPPVLEVPTPPPLA